jgi:acyl-CoA thioester hydrolase
MNKHLWRARVYYEDTDAGGVVYYANYLRFAERARTESLRESGLTHAGLLAQYGMFFVARHAVADYRAPARLDDLLCIETETTRCGGATLDMRQIVRLEEAGDPARSGDPKGDLTGKILFETKVTLCAVTREGKVFRLPDALRKVFGG